MMNTNGSFVVGLFLLLTACSTQNLSKPKDNGGGSTGGSILLLVSCSEVTQEAERVTIEIVGEKKGTEALQGTIFKGRERGTNPVAYGPVKRLASEQQDLYQGSTFTLSIQKPTLANGTRQGKLKANTSIGDLDIAVQCDVFE